MNKEKTVFLLRVLAGLTVALVLALSFFKLKETRAVMATKNDCVIIIDPGHGGPDGGAVAQDNTLEKDLNLEIALCLKDYFSLGGFYVEMTREDDLDGISWDSFNKAEDMDKRVILANSFPNAVVISIHQNKFTDSKYSGSQVFYSENNEESRILAELIQKGIKENLQNQNERLPKGGNENSCVLALAQNPTVIVECGFLSNFEELCLLKTEEYRNKMAFSIYSSVVEFLNLQE